jgi:glycogen(starch) synthase
MRILMVSEDVPAPAMGGLARHALTLARALVRAGHEVDFLGSGEVPLEAAAGEADFGGRFIGELRGHYSGWKEVRLGMYMPPRRSWLARNLARSIMRHARAYDVVHYHGHIPNVALHIPQDINFVQTRHDQGSECLLNTRFARGQVCTTTNPMACGGCRTANPNPVQSLVSAVAVNIYRREVAQAFRRHKTVFVSDMLRFNFTRVMGAEPWGVTVHNFIDRDTLLQSWREAPARDDGKLSLFMAGKLYAAKGIEAFLRELAPRLSQQVTLTIAGDGDDLARLRAEFASEQVRFLGWCSQEQVLQHTAAAHAVIVPSVWEEPCATTILEALALGRATFALARGGTPELRRYAAPGQLRLFPDMSSLVTAALAYQPGTTYPPISAEAGVERAVQSLLTLYRLPPGSFGARHTEMPTISRNPDACL